MTHAEEKLQELMLYVADRSVGDAYFGAIKLNKILAAIDFESYARTGTAVTGVPYQKLKHGPAPRRLLPLQRELINDRSAELVPRQFAGHEQQRLVALRDPDLSTFAPEEIAFVDAVIERCRRYNGAELSDQSHEMGGWQAVRLGQDIPYNTAYWFRHEPTSEDFELADTLSAG